MPAFKIDENLPTEVALELRAAGFDAVTVLDQDLGGQPDLQVAAVCRAEGRVLVTLDTDFTDMRAFPPAQHPGIVVLRVQRQDKGTLVELTRRLLSALNVEPLAGRLDCGSRPHPHPRGWVSGPPAGPTAHQGRRHLLLDELRTRTCRTTWPARGRATWLPPAADGAGTASSPKSTSS